MGFSSEGICLQVVSWDSYQEAVVVVSGVG